MKIQGANPSNPKWASVLMDYTMFSDPGLVKQVLSKLLPDGCKLHGTFHEVIQAFAAPGLTSCTVSIGTMSDSEEFSNVHDVMQMADQKDSENSRVAWGADIDIMAEAIAVGANLDTFTAGKILLRFLISKI